MVKTKNIGMMVFAFVTDTIILEKLVDTRRGRIDSEDGMMQLKNTTAVVILII